MARHTLMKNKNLFVAIKLPKNILEALFGSFVKNAIANPEFLTINSKVKKCKAICHVKVIQEGVGGVAMFLPSIEEVNNHLIDVFVGSLNKSH